MEKGAMDKYSIGNEKTYNSDNSTGFVFEASNPLAEKKVESIALTNALREALSGAPPCSR